LKIEEFRKHKFLPQEWRKLLATNGILQTVMQLMEENHPARFSLNGDNDGDISATRASIELGLTRGYSLYADRLRLLSVPIASAAQMPEPTYEAPPKPEE
jgi:hypothetical protein